MKHEENYLLTSIGFIESIIKNRDDAPKQESEGAPDAWIRLHDDLTEGLESIGVGDNLILITWFHKADRGVLKVHPRDNLNNPLRGVFATRSADRPNPLGLHHVTVKQIIGNRMQVGPLEAIDGTPVVDIKPRLL